MALEPPFEPQNEGFKKIQLLLQTFRKLKRSPYLLIARANRHHLPGYVWHIAYRCHLKEFLLKFEKDNSGR